MTVEEAKKIVRLEDALEFFKKQSMLEQVVASEDWKHFSVAVETIKKQIPKKPVKKNPICYQKTKDGQESYEYDYHCPNCDTKVNSEGHHCPCGQALDWRETEKGGAE